MESEPVGKRGISRGVRGATRNRGAIAHVESLRGDTNGGKGWFTIGKLDEETHRVTSVIAVPLEEAEELLVEMMGVITRARQYLREHGDL